NNTVSLSIHRTYRRTLSIFFYSSDDHRTLHSFPTRRSSDLAARSRERRRSDPPVALVDAACRGRDDRRNRNRRVAALAEGTRHRSEEHTSELQSRFDLVCRLLLEKKKG